LIDDHVRQRKATALRKAELLSIAGKIFAEEGYAETSIERILKEAGLTGPALYRHFSSKQEILDTVCIRWMELAIEGATDIQRERNSTPAEMLTSLIKSRLNDVFGPMGASSLLIVNEYSHLSTAAREQVTAKLHEFKAIVVALLKEIRPETTAARIEVALYATQTMIVHTIWKYKDQSMIGREDLKNLLGEITVNTLLSA
jgi:AcrR family transcriptional regulator